MNISRIVSFGAVLSSVVFAASVGGGCSSSSGTTNTNDAGTGKGSGTGSHSGSGTGTGTGHGSSSGSGTGSSTGTGTGSGAGCEIAAGTYTEHTTPTVDGGAACAAESFTFAYPPVVHDAGVTDAHTDAGNPCTTTVAGCVTTQDCTYVVAGDTTKTTDVQTVSSSGGVTGTHSSTT